MSKHQSRSQRRASKAQHAMHEYDEWMWVLLAANAREEDDGGDASDVRRMAERAWRRVVHVFNGNEEWAAREWNAYVDIHG